MYSKAIELIERPQAKGDSKFTLSVGIFNEQDAFLDSVTVAVDTSDTDALQVAVDAALQRYLDSQARVVPIFNDIRSKSVGADVPVVVEQKA